MNFAVASGAASPWSQVGSPVWALVSCFSSEQRKTRLLLMLQIYVDDSGDAGSTAAFMAGFLSTAERWAAFSDDWKAVLDERPTLKYLKMSEAAACKGEFYGWASERRDDRMGKFVAAIKKHVDYGVVSAIRAKDFREIF
jgi:hypothetical protein